jgi:hypothetical protein
LNMEHLIWVLQGLVGIVLAMGGYAFKAIFHRLERNEGRLNSLEVAMAKNMEQNRSIFQRLETIEEKIDRLLEKR